MAKDKDLKTPNVPPLRFPGFTDEWKKTTLGDISVSISSGKSGNPIEDGDYYLYGSTGIIGLTDNGDYDGEKILVARVGANAGRINYNNCRCGITDNTLIIRIKEYSTKFIYFHLIHSNLNRLVFGSGQPLITGGMLKKLSIGLPSSKECDKIVSLLNCIEERIATQNKIIEDLKKLKSAIIDIVIGKSDFPKIRFEEIYDRAGEGGTPATSTQEYYLNGKIPFVKIEDLANKYLVSSKDFITELGLCKSSTWVVPTNSIIYSNGATIGAISINKIPVCTKQGILGIVPKEKYHVEYLYYLMTTTYFRKQIERIVTEGTMRTAYLKDINHIECPIPDLETQKKIASMLRNLSNKLELEQSILTNHTNQKRFVLSSMFI